MLQATDMEGQAEAMMAQHGIEVTRLDVKDILFLLPKLWRFVVGPIRAWCEDREKRQQRAEVAVQASIGIEKRKSYIFQAAAGQHSYIVGRVGEEPLSKTAYERVVCDVFLHNEMRADDFLVDVEEIVDTVRMHPVTVTDIAVPTGRLGKVSMMLSGGGAGVHELRIRLRTPDERIEVRVPLVVGRSMWPAGGLLERTPVRGL